MPLPIASTSNSPDVEKTAEISSNSQEPEADTTTVEQSNEIEFSSLTTLPISISNDAASETENASKSDIADSSESLKNSEIASNIHSNDPGLWPVVSNQSILQSYWAKKFHFGMSD